MTTYRIAEVAERTGFTATALRYYEQIGLLEAPQRTSSGYRQYDDRAIARLGFIARAKQLGISLDELRDLVRLWDAESCAPVQTRLANVVAAKLGETRARIDELHTLADQLESRSARLGAPAPNGPCTEACACVADTHGEQVVTYTAGVAHTRTHPIVCTLDAAEMPGRRNDWDRLLASVRRREPLADGVRLHFHLGDELAVQITTLAAAEQACCAFLDFSVHLTPEGPILDVRAPGEAVALVTSIFGDGA